MIDLMNVVQAIDPKALKAEMKAQGIPFVNVKPLLNFIADKTNEKRLLEGSWYSVATMCAILGVSRTTLYRMRDAAEKLGLILVIEDESEPDERGKTSILVLTTTITLYVNQKLYERIAGVGKVFVREEWHGLPVWFLGEIWEYYFPFVFTGYRVKAAHPVQLEDGTVPPRDGDYPTEGRIPYQAWTEWVSLWDGDRPSMGAEPEVVTENESQGNTKGKKAGSSAKSQPTIHQGTLACELESGCDLEAGHLGVCKDSRGFPIDGKFHINTGVCEPWCNKGVGHEGKCFHEEVV